MTFYYRVIQAFLYYTTTPINRTLMRLGGGRVGKEFHTRGIIKIRNYTGNGGIVIGNYVNINSCPNADPIGGEFQTVFYTHHGGKIVIGNHVGMSNCVLCAHNQIIVGDRATIGSGVKIYDTDFHPLDAEMRQKGYKGTITKPVSIGEDTFIGGHSIILKGVTIGKGAIVGAGSVVTKDIPDGEIWAGNPAVFCKKIG